MDLWAEFRLLDMVLKYDALCRDALGKISGIEKLFVIDAREAIGRAKMADPENFDPVYDKIEADMRAQIEAVVSEGGEG